MYIGNTPTTQNFIAGTDQFTGDGSATNFTLSRFVNSVNDIQVTVANVVQNPTSYSASGNTLTISPAVGNGVAVYVRYLSTTLQSIGVGDLTVSTNKIQDGAVTTAKIAEGAVIPADLSTGAPSWTSAGLLSFNSGYGSNAVAYGCRAWVNFNGTGTVAIRASGNVSSITDNGVGDYTINFTTAMPDANYSVSLTTQSGDTLSNTRSAVIRATADGTPSTTMLAGSVRMLTGNTTAGGLIDSAVLTASVFR